MIEQVRTLLQERQLTRAAIIDDAYDDHPRVGDLEGSLWDRFWTDLRDEEVVVVSTAYGTEEYDKQDPSELSREQMFVNALWPLRATVATVGALFAAFETDQNQKRLDLQPLQTLLESELQLTCQTLGRDGIPSGDVDIVFLDLILGFQEVDEAVTRSIQRIKGIVDPRREAPPVVVLLSHSSRLEETGPRLRDDARLLGCQFRMLKKSELTHREPVLERLYELALAREDSLKLNGFLLAWEHGIDDAREAFLRSIRRLDLPDYANVGELVLKAEGELLGDYILDLYDLHFHSVLEGNEALVRTARQLSAINVNGYFPPQFMPSLEMDEMMDAALFENEGRTRVDAEVTDLAPRFGDVFLAPAPAPAADGATAAPLQAFVVLSQPCDLQREPIDQILLIGGAVKAYSASQHERLVQFRTPIMKTGDLKVVIEWDIKTPITWKVNELSAKITAGYRRVRRFRAAFALQLQQAFVGNLSRVGTLTSAPARYPTGVKVFLRKKDGNALLLADGPIANNDAVCLVGRSKNSTKDWLFLSPSLQVRIREALTSVPADQLPTQGGPVRIADVINDLDFYRALKGGLELKRTAEGSHPFKGPPSKHDVVQIITSPKIESGGPVAISFRPLILQVELD